MNITDRTAARSGAIWTVMSSVISMVTQLGRVMILTRFLEKADFGIVAIVNVIIGFCTVFSDLGFTSVLLYKKRMSPVEFSSLYWVQFFVFAVIYVILVILSPYFGKFYGEPQLIDIIPLSSLGLICIAMGKQYETVLQMEYKFNVIAVRNIITNVLSLILAAYLAYNRWGVYSLVLSTLFQLLIINIWNIISGYNVSPLSFTINLNIIKPLLKIGLYQTYTRIFDYFASKLDIIIIGKFLGTEAVGVYDLSKSLVYRIIDFIRAVITQVATPIITNNNTKPEVVTTRFLQLTNFVAITCIPICFAFATFSKEILFIAYGSEYTDAYIILSVFSITTMVGCIISAFDILGVAKGRTDLNFKSTVYRTLISIPFVLISCSISLELVTIVQLVLTVLLSFLNWKIVVEKTYPIKPILFCKQFAVILMVMILVSLTTLGICQVMTIFLQISNELIFIYKIILFCALCLFSLMTLQRDQAILIIKMFLRK